MIHRQAQEKDPAKGAGGTSGVDALTSRSQLLARRGQVERRIKDLGREQASLVRERRALDRRIALCERDRLADAASGACRLFFISTAAVELAYQLCLALTSQQGSFVDVVFLRWLPSTLLDCVVFLPFVFFLSRIGSSGPQLGKKKSGRTRKGSYRIKGL